MSIFKGEPFEGREEMAKFAAMRFEWEPGDMTRYRMELLAMPHEDGFAVMDVMHEKAAFFRCGPPITPEQLQELLGLNNIHTQYQFLRAMERCSSGLRLGPVNVTGLKPIIEKLKDQGYKGFWAKDKEAVNA